MKSYQHTVQYYETDKMQFTHHSNYIRFMEEARADFMNQAGFGYEKMEENGIVSPVVSLSCDYKKTTSFPDVITIQIRVLQLSAARLKLGYVMTVSDETVCLAESTHCFLNEKGRPVSLKKHFPAFYSFLESRMTAEDQKSM